MCTVNFLMWARKIWGLLFRSLPSAIFFFLAVLSSLTFVHPDYYFSCSSLLFTFLASVNHFSFQKIFTQFVSHNNNNNRREIFLLMARLRPKSFFWCFYATILDFTGISAYISEGKSGPYLHYPPSNVTTTSNSHKTKTSLNFFFKWKNDLLFLFFFF